jgi:zinc D-Ala-D-Ala carboxypeptidase
MTPHFTLAELTQTKTGLPNIPSKSDRDNLALLAAVLEAIREIVGNHPVTVLSGYRSEAVNRAVGGAWNSYHLQGLAADITCPAYGNPAEICAAIIDSGLLFDQLILEPGWVHYGLSAPDATLRGQVLTKIGQRYVPGLKPHKSEALT